MPEIDEYFLHYGIRNDFDYIKPIGADINDKNIVPPIGKFLLNSTTMHNADITIYNAEMSDRLIVKKMNERALKSGLEFCRNSDKNPLAFKYVYLEIIIAEMLKPYTADEIDYKCYQIERKKIISYGDELGTILLYFLFLTGNERIEECLSNIRETSDRLSKYGLGYQYYFSELSIRDLRLDELCISAQYYILEEYIDMNWKKFKNYIREIGGMTKPISRRNLILHPFDFIYTERNGTIRIYRIE